MKIVGICGSSGSGKSTVCQLLSKRKIPVLDCDKIYHALVSEPSPCLSAIGKEFGNDLIENNFLDRSKLRKIVFSDPIALDRLNEISHHYVKEELKKELKKLKSAGEPIVVIDAPMLFEAGLDLWCDLVCAVIANPDIQVQRICERDHLKSEDAIARIQKQITPEALRTKAGFILENNGDLSDLNAQCDRLMQTISSLK